MGGLKNMKKGVSRQVRHVCICSVEQSGRHVIVTFYYSSAIASTSTSTGWPLPFAYLYEHDMSPFGLANYPFADKSCLTDTRSQT